MTTTPDYHYAIIPHPTNASVLVLAEGAYWTLPRYAVTGTNDLHRAIQEQFGLDVTILNDNSCFRNNWDQQQHFVYAVDNHSFHWSPPENACWIGRVDLADIALSVPEHRAVLETWFDEIEYDNIPTRRVLWARLGWFDRAVAWITQHVTQAGYALVAPIEQVHVRVWSTVLRVPTSGGMLYFKASGPSYTYEPALTQYLSIHWSHDMPHVLAVDTQQTWMLMKDAGRPLRDLLLAGDTRSNSIYLEQAYARYAQFQIETAAYTDTLLMLGCSDRRLHMLPTLFEQVVADTSILLPGQKEGISEADLHSLQAFTPQVREMCDELASYKLPETLHHDDFHTNNILVNEQGYVFFDWGDSAITHPFCSLYTALRSAKYRLHYDERTLLRLRDIYLEAWTSFAPKEQLLAAFHIAQRLGMLSRTLTWYEVISPLEDKMRWAYENAVPYWLRTFLMNTDPDA